jgi:hypothetical protein
VFLDTWAKIVCVRLPCVRALALCGGFVFLELLLGSHELACTFTRTIIWLVCGRVRTKNLSDSYIYLCLRGLRLLCGNILLVEVCGVVWFSRAHFCILVLH